MVSFARLINENTALMIYFFSPGWVACNSPGVYSTPTILVYFEGKEYIRESKYISIQQLEDKIRRYYDMIFS